MDIDVAVAVEREQVDENLWLEDVYAADALAWAKEQNQASMQALSSPALDALTQDILEVMDSDERIALVNKHGDHYYNFWRDSEHPRGLWRRTTLESYRSAATEWEILVDIDKLGRHEKTEWVFSWAQLLAPANNRALIGLSPDGGDAVTIREFDLAERAFVVDGFLIPTAKSRASWIDHDSIFIATDFGSGSMTSSSYPRTVRRLGRGQALADAAVVHEIGSDDMGVYATHDQTPGFERDFVVEDVDYHHRRHFLLVGAERVLIETPEDADVTVHHEWLLVQPRSNWTIGDVTHQAGSLLAVRFDDFLAGERRFDVLFEQDEHSSLQSWDWTLHYLVLTFLVDVSSRLVALDPARGWAQIEVPSIPPLRAVRVVDTDPEGSDEYWIGSTGFTTPPSLLRGVLGEGEPELTRSSPEFFDSSNIEVQQHWVRSDDGTAVPYFQLAAKSLVLDGSNPTLLFGYGGYQIAKMPEYNGVLGRAWLERGGVYVVANIRGGGEFGPAWHTAALKANRLRAHEDFAAVARDLVSRGVTSPSRLGCEGRSNGGLLVGNMLTRYPELFGAVICGVPLLDMRRYTHLSAGASWIAELGDPDDPAEWEFIRTYSPYQLLQSDTDYPPMFIYTATSDDRVGPVQGRKMAARMQAMSIPDVLYYENADGGHGGAVDNSHSARLFALTYEFLWKHLS